MTASRKARSRSRDLKSNQTAKKSIQVVTWNVENLFHPETGGPRYDLTPYEGWTPARYKAKVKRVAKAIEKMVSGGREQGTPFLVGLTEVENERVVKDLLEHLPPHFALARDPHFMMDYHDCVVLYDKSFFDMESCSYNQVFDRFPRGDVVRANFRVKKSKEQISVFCCHLKARPSNQYYTEMYRQAVCDDMQTAVWKIHDGMKVRDAAQRAKDDSGKKPQSLQLNKNIVIMGDFNDEPFSSSLIDYLNASYDRNYVINQSDIKRVVLYNCAWEWLSQEKPGSYYWQKGSVSEWSLLDQVVVSPALLSGKAGLRYVPNSFRVEQEITATEEGAPFRTCTWDENDAIVWQKGYSDHFPVRIDVEFV